jgi:hypothetical protein
MRIRVENDGILEELQCLQEIELQGEEQEVIKE